MSDAAAFKATFAGLRSLTDGDYRISFDFPGEVLKEVVEVLAHGGKPSAAKGTWFGIARLHNEGTGEAPPWTTPSGSTLQQRDNVEDAAAGEAHLPNKPPSRSLSQDAFWLCNQPTGRVYLEQRRRHAIPPNNHINNVDEAKHVLRSWLGIESLSELDRDPAAADRWEKVEADYKTWLTAARYVETP